MLDITCIIRKDGDPNGAILTILDGSSLELPYGVTRGEAIEAIYECSGFVVDIPEDTAIEDPYTVATVAFPIIVGGSLQAGSRVAWVPAAYLAKDYPQVFKLAGIQIEPAGEPFDASRQRRGPLTQIVCKARDVLPGDILQGFAVTGIRSVYGREGLESTDFRVTIQDRPSWKIAVAANASVVVQRRT